MRAPFAVLTVRNGVTACMMIAAVALLSVESIGPLHALVLAAAILYGRWLRKPSIHPRLWDAMAIAALLLFPFDLVLLSRDLIGSALRLLTFVVIYRCSNLSEQRDLRQAISLSFVQILAAAASTTEVSFSFFLVSYLFMATWTLMAATSARDEAPPPARRPPTGRSAATVTASTVAIGAVIFFTIPHFGTGYFQPGSIVRQQGDGLTGFSDRIELGSIRRIKENRAIVMRVAPRGVADPQSLNLRWRGMALDTFDGRSWSLSTAARAWVEPDRDGSFRIGRQPPAGRPAFVQEISMMPLLSPILFAAPGVTRVVGDDFVALGVDTGGAIHLTSPRLSRFDYRAVSAPPGAPIPTAGEDLESPSMARYLTLPRVDPRVDAITRRAAGTAADDAEAARRIESFLRESRTYTLDVNDAGVADPLEHFLLDGKPGHCEYFATSMAVMLRYLGIPSRVVSGFAAGEWSGLDGSFVVRQSDAHAWVEAFIRGSGWMTFDPTPVRREEDGPIGLFARISRGLVRVELLWDRWIIGLDLLDQRMLAAAAGEAVTAAAATTARALQAALSAAIGVAARLATPEATWTGAVALAAVLLLVAARRLGWPASLGIRGRRETLAHVTGAGPAAEAFRRFERHWAARGVRRAPGQTPLEFAREIERRRLGEPGQAVGYVRSYYRSRFGEPDGSSAAA